MKSASSKQRLSDVVVKKVQYDPDGPTHQLLWDDSTEGGERGLGVQVNEGSKSWLFFGRVDGTGKQVRKVIGRTDTFTYVKARKKAAAWRGMCADGIDPRDDGKRITGPDQDTLRHLWNDYADTKRLAQSTLTEYTRLLAHVEDWMPRPHRDITKQDCRDRFRDIERTYTHDQARRVFSTLGSIMKFGVITADENNPANNPVQVLQALEMMGREESDDVPRYTIDQMAALGRELRDWHAKDVRQCGQATAKWFMWWIVFSGNRLGEASRIRWENVHSDRIVLKAGDTKSGKRSGKDFEVPLTAQLGRVIEALRPLSNESDWVFPSFDNPTQNIWGKDVLPKARDRGKLTWMKKTPEEPFAPVHRLRHTLRQVGCDPTDATDPNHRGLGLDSNAVSAVLNHKIEGNVSQTTYSYLTGLPKKRDTLQAIDDTIEALTGAVR